MRRSRLLLFALSLLLPIIGSTAFAQDPTLTTRVVATGLDTPWEIIWGPDNWIWMTERYGRVSRVNPETGEVRPLLTIADVHENGEAGLLGMALHPNFTDSAHVFLVYTYLDGGQIREKLVRYTYNGTTLTSPITLIADLKGNTTHDGSRLLITPDRKLFVTVGDAQDQPAAQNHASLNGKILRMNLDGTAPADNPWGNAAFPTNLLWSTGHRNPQGIVLAPNGILYSSEHGPNNDDEINIIAAGRNYGWPTVQGYCDKPAETQFCQDSNVAQPIKAWTPTLAVAGIDYYASTAIPEWNNSLLMVSLKEADLRQFPLSADGMQITGERVLYNNQYGRLRDLCIAPDGRVFLATSNKDGRGAPIATDDRIIELKSPNTPAPATITAVDITPGDTVMTGDSIDVRISVDGEFSAGNIFTVELSDAGGSFASPTAIGSLAARNDSMIRVQIPCDAPAGPGYRVRAVASLPAGSAASQTNLTVTTWIPQISPAGTTKICPETSTLLDAGPGKRYRWSNGQTTRQIQVHMGGTYSATVTRANGCSAQTPAATVVMHPRPEPEITDTVVDGGVILDGGAGYVIYQWSTPGGPIEGATSRTYQGVSDTMYTLTVIDSNGCTGTAMYRIFIDEVAWEKSGSGFVVYPQPARDRIVMEATLVKGGNVEIVLTDMRGRDMLRIRERAPAGAYRNEISLGDLPAGAYLLQLHAGGKHWREKIIRE